MTKMKTCKYCDLPVSDLYLECCNCDEIVHLTCTKRKGTPGGLEGDVFFIYTCQGCNSGDRELFERAKMTWVDIATLVLYNLTRKYSRSSKGNGYFHRDRQIKKFLNDNWSCIFPHMKSKRKTWRQMLFETLRKYPQYFKSNCLTATGNATKTPMWFTLARPDMLPNQPLLDRQRKKVESKRGRDELASETETSTGYDSSSQDGEATTSVEGSSIAESKLNIMSLNSDNNMYSRSYVKPSARLSEFLFAGEEDSYSPGDEEVDIEAVDMEMAVDFKVDEGILAGVPTGNLECESEDTMSVKEDSVSGEGEDNTVVEMSPSPSPSRRLLKTNPNSTLLPWITAPPTPGSKCKAMNLGEEAYELSKLSKRVQSAELLSVAELRLHRKLVVRRLRRERGLPLLDVDAYSRGGGPQAPLTPAQRPSRVLDRFRRRTVASDIAGVDETFWTRLMGHTEQYTCFTSPLTKRVLKAYIRRDYESQPLWLRLCAEIRARGGGIKEPLSPITYSYVRPHHIPAVNSLAEQYFWPGINLSECLQYPDFSCVVLYKKLVVGFAFLVPDVEFNVAYLSFIFTRPEWRRAGIATFMLYHLIQTCMGKDITLHVSATNPALLLYQKFGFKVEEFIQDFYDKYLPVESSECRHALFLRLSRLNLPA